MIKRSEIHPCPPELHMNYEAKVGEEKSKLFWPGWPCSHVVKLPRLLVGSEVPQTSIPYWEGSPKTRPSPSHNSSNISVFLLQKVKAITNSKSIQPSFIARELTSLASPQAEITVPPRNKNPKTLQLWLPQDVWTALAQAARTSCPDHRSASGRGNGAVQSAPEDSIGQGGPGLDFRPGCKARVMRNPYY